MDRPEEEPGLRIVFLGSSGAIQVPSFYCSCAVCRAARADPQHRRTRASLALIGRETIVIDPSPDLEFQLERESIRQVDRVFVTHWHFDHVWGLGGLGDAASHLPWPPIEIYLPRGVVHHFDQELAYMKPHVNLHPIAPGDRVELPDATWQVVKTSHTEHSVGFIVEASQCFAYLVDGVIPPPETLECLDKANLDLAIIEATMDELDEEWCNFSVPQAVDFWRQLGTDKCILTHLTCHGWRNHQLVAGFSHEERLAYEAKRPGLEFAYDGMTVVL